MTTSINPSISHLFKNLTIAIIYSIFYDWIYKSYMFPIFGYMNVEYNEMSFGIYCVWLCMSCIPIVRYGNCNSISSFFCFFIYLFIYVPCVHALFVSNALSSNTICMYSIAFLFIMLLLFNVQNKTSRL